MGNYIKGFEYCQKSLIIRTKLNDNICVLASYDNFGNLFKAAGDYEGALDCYQKSLRYAKVNNILWDENGALGSIYCRLNKFDSSFHYLFQSLNKTQNDPVILQSLTETYLARKKYDSSLKISSNLANIQTQRRQDSFDGSPLNVGKAILARIISKPQNSRQKVSLSQKPARATFAIEGYQLMANIYSKTGHLDSAFSYLNKYTVIKDSVLTHKFLSRLNYYATLSEGR
jgi:tetratricopeptide (TPR) repeat protein